jgi:hypothetical protein
LLGAGADVAGVAAVLGFLAFLAFLVDFDVVVVDLVASGALLGVPAAGAADLAATGGAGWAGAGFCAYADTDTATALIIRAVRSLLIVGS